MSQSQLALGLELAKNGAKLAYDGANDAWKADAKKAVCQAALELPEITTDDVLARMPRNSYTREPRALGAVMQLSAKDGLIESTDRVRRSANAVCHGRPKAVWVSNIFRKAAGK